MDTGKAIFLGLALIALAIFATDVMRPAQAGLMGGGRYMGVASVNHYAVHVIDTETGAARYCQFIEGTHFDGKDCGPWKGK